MTDFLLKLLINTLALVAVVRLVPGIRFDGEPLQLLAVALIFGAINSYLRPLLRIVSLPLNLVTLGLVGFVINVALLLLLAFVSQQLALGFSIAGWPPGRFDGDVVIAAVFASLVVSIVSTALGLMRLVLPRI